MTVSISNYTRKLTRGALLALLLQPCLSHAAGGDPDASFATNGIAIEAVDLVPGGIDQVQDLVVAPDNSVYAIGMAQSDWLNPQVKVPVVVKYKANGVVDTNWGTQGSIQVNSQHNVTFGPVVRGALTPNGNLFVAAEEITADRGPITMFSQYKPNGTRDWGAFGGNGAAGHIVPSLGGISIDAQGRIITVATIESSIHQATYVMVCRDLANGQSDPSFAGGACITGAPIANRDATAKALRVASNGDIFVGGTLRSTHNELDFAVWKFTANGNRDTTFGNGGTNTYWFDLNGLNDDTLHDLELRPDGSLVAVGAADQGNGRTSIVAVSINSIGNVIPSFGNQTPRNGKLVLGFNNGTIGDSATAIATDSTGRMVVSLTVESSNGLDFGALRLLADGSLDQSFGLLGFRFYGYNYGSFDESAHAVGIDSQDRILLGGRAGYSSADDDYMLMRLKP